MGYYEIKDEEITIGRDGATASMTIFCPYVDAIDYAQNSVGGLITNFGVIKFVIGAQFPRNGLPLYANNVKIKPLGTYDAVNLDWLDAEVQITYGMLDQPDSPSGVEIGDVSYKVMGEELVLPKKSFKIGSSGGTALPETSPDPIKIVSKAELVIAFKYKPTVDPTSWLSYVGKINRTDFYNHAAGTVMFQSPETKRSVNSEAEDVWSYQYSFAIQPQGWNYYWNPDPSGNASTPGAWQELFPHQYESVDLNNLF